jgi:branched-chain amino acid transport system ATP-binding protein
MVPDIAARPVLRTRRISKAFGGQTVLDAVSVELRRGEVVLLRGDNGSGKTTLLNILSGNLEPDVGKIELSVNGAEEGFTFPRSWWQRVNLFDHFTPERVADEGVGRTWQEMRLFSTMDLRNNIAVASPHQLGENPAWALLRRRAVHQYEQTNVANAGHVLAELGLKGRESASADRISLGQSKRVAIARAVQAGARLLFLDEPLAGLDASGVNNVLRLLEGLVRDHNVTLVIVEHVFNIPLLLDWAHTVWTLKRGKITVENPVAVQEEIRQPLGWGLQGWFNEMSGSERTISEQRFAGGAKLSTIISSDKKSGDVVLEVKGLIVERGNRVVIGGKDKEHPNGLSFVLRDGEIAVLEASNGWGKSTLLDAIAGLLPVKAGEIRLRGRPIESLPAWQRSRFGISLLQSQNHTFPNLTVKDSLRLIRSGELPETLQPLLNRKMSSLSGGEKQKLALNSVLPPRQATLRLLDEPFSMLDRASIQQLQHSLQPGDGEAILIAVPGTLESLSEDKNE